MAGWLVVGECRRVSVPVPVVSYPRICCCTATDCDDLPTRGSSAEVVRRCRDGVKAGARPVNGVFLAWIRGAIWIVTDSRR